jgi:hypothetical protein
MKKNTKSTPKASFTGTSQRGDLTEALQAAIQQAEKSSGVVDGQVRWELVEISGEHGGIAGRNEISVIITASGNVGPSF